MRMRNFARRRAAAHAPATTQCKASPQSEAPSAPEPLAVEEPKSAVNSLQESESPTAPPNEAWTRRKRSHPREQEASNDADGAYLALQKRLRDDGSVPIAATYYCLLQSAVAQEDRIDETSWLTSSLIDLVLWRLATQYANVHFLATDFCHLHLPSIARKVASGGRRSPIELYDIRDVLGRPVDYTSTRPIVFVANVSHIHWNLLRVQFHPHAELQLFEPMGRLSSRSGISYRSVPRCVIEWLDACYPQPKSWIAHSVSAITRPQQVSGFDCGVACLLYANKCGQGQPRESINESTNQHEITTFRTELQRQLECELRPRAQTPGGVDEV